MITYNQEKYIAKAIDSVLMQKCNFDYEIVIGEDCATDNTRNILREYKEKYTEKIKLLLNERNIGMLPNLIQTLKAAKGKYIALLEGDDYWTDPYKLQKQVDFLENHPDYVLCSHNGTILDEIGTDRTGQKLIPSDKDFDFKTEDLIINNRASTLTVMFRNGLIKQFPDWYTKFPGGDRSLYIILSQYGKMRHLEFDGAVYRLNYGGISVKRKLKDEKIRKQAMLKELEGFPFYLETLNKYLNYKYDKTVRRQKKNYFYKIFLYYFALKKYKQAKKLIEQQKITLKHMHDLKSIIKFFLVKYIL
jgi:glycosyltransferase involved in cell wall biosynthesis